MVDGGWGTTFWFFKSKKKYTYYSLGIYITGHKRYPCINIPMGFKIDVKLGSWDFIFKTRMGKCISTNHAKSVGNTYLEKKRKAYSTLVLVKTLRNNGF